MSNARAASFVPSWDSLVRIVPLDPDDPTMTSTWQELEQAVGECDNGDAGAICRGSSSISSCVTPMAIR